MEEFDDMESWIKKHQKINKCSRYEAIEDYFYEKTIAALKISSRQQDPVKWLLETRRV